MQRCFGSTLPVRGATVLLAGLFFVAPHKFGNIVNPVGPVGGSVFPTSTIEWIVDREGFHSKGKNTPYHGLPMKGRVTRTIYGGATVYVMPESPANIHGTVGN